VSYLVVAGETFQATFSNGTEVFCEQVSHHPPVSAFELVGPNRSWHFYGRGAWVASFRGNSVKGYVKIGSRMWILIVGVGNSLVIAR